MKLVEQKEKGALASCCHRKSGNKNIYKKPRNKAWRKWMKNRDNDEDAPMYNRYSGWEL